MTFRPIGLTPRLVLIALIVLWPTITVAVLLLESGYSQASEEQAIRQLKATSSLLTRMIEGLDLPEDEDATPEERERQFRDELLRHFKPLVAEQHFTILAVYAPNEEGWLEPLAFESSVIKDQRPTLLHSEAYGRDGVVVRSVDRSEIPHLAVATTVRRDGKRYVVHAEFAEPERTKTNRLDVQIGTFIGLVSSAAITALLALFMRLAVTRPMGALAHAMSNIRAAGPGGTLPVQGEGQLGRLIRTFNEMSLDLKRSEVKNRGLMQEMREFNRKLERRVREATEDIERKNTELMATEKQLYTIQQEVSRLERLASLGQLSSTLAHELSTPLNVVLGHLELLERDPALSDSSRNRVRTLTTQVNRLVAILREMLSAVRLPDPRPLEFPIKPLVDDCMRFMLPAMSGRGIEVVRRGPDVDCLVFADRNQAQQVMLNVVSNAIEATPDGGQIEIDILPGEQHVTVRVRDTGRGIPQEHFERLFEPFFTTKASGRGTGLGLSISREIMKRNHGTITATSHPERGAVFEITFPIARPVPTHEQPLSTDHAHR